jgi:DNA-binding SARP family transcriptional activator
VPRTSAVTPDHFTTFGELLKFLRRRAGLTQRELSIGVGYTESQISRLEQNQRPPDEASLTARFVPALRLELEREWTARLLELASASRAATEPDNPEPRRVHMAAALNLQLLGGFRLVADEQPIIQLDTPRLRALLAYLVLRRGVSQSRQQLAFLLWPDSSEGQARNNLRTLLHRLRVALPNADAHLSLTLQTVAWQANSPLVLDVAEFEMAVARAARAEQAGDEPAAIAAFERAAALYQGDLIPDCYDDWIQPERERLQREAFSVLERLAQHLEQSGDDAPAIDYARRLRELDPLRETTCLRLMRLHAARGDRAGALRAYHTYVTTLHNELAVEPSPTLRRAYEQLLAADAPLSTPVAGLAPSAPVIGRETEWARMQAVWQTALDGRARLLLLTGEAGIGKTRLLEDLLSWASRQGVATAVAHCYGAEGALAYAPVTTWLRSDALQRRLIYLEPAWLREVARLIPDALARRPDLAQADPLTEPWQRQRLFEALARAMLAGERPLLLAIDDLQWCDRDTLQWLHFLVRYEPRAPLLVAATVRDGEAGGDRPLAALLDDLRRGGQLTELPLRRLNPAETAALANNLAGRPVVDEEANNLYAETEGNPLFVVETVRAGLARQAQSEGTQEGSPARAAHMPPGIAAAIGQRLSQLRPSARELLEVAAVIGRSFTVGVLARAAAGDEAALVRGLDELWQRRIVREHGVDAYDFSHDKLRAVAYAELSPVRQRRLQRRVAEALEAEYTGNLDRVSGQIAAHYEQAGLPDQAAAYYERAAEAAKHLYANAEAIQHLRRAVGLLTPASSDERRAWTARLSQKLGDLLHLSGRYAEARSAYDGSLGLIPKEDRLARAAMRLKIGNAWRDHYRYEEAFAEYAAAEAELNLTANEAVPELWQAWVQIKMDQFQTHYWLAQILEMFRLMEAIRPVIERHGSSGQRARIHQLMAIATLRRDRLVATDEVVAYARSYLAAVEASEEASALPAAHFQLGYILLWHNDLEGAEPELLAALESAERTGDRSLEARCLTYLTILKRKCQQVEAVQRYVERSQHVARAVEMPDYLGAAEANRAWLAGRVGDLAQARAHGQKALEQWRRTPIAFGAQWTALWPLIGAALAAGQVAEAVAHGRAVLDPLQQRPPEQLDAALKAAVQAGERGDFAAAQAALEGTLSAARKLGYL